MEDERITIHDLYDHHTFLIMQLMLNRSSSCIDVGAHVGSVLREILRLCPDGTHFAFEPIPHLFNALRSQFPNVSVYDHACSDDEGVSTFYHVLNDPAYSGLKQRRYDRPDPELEEITVSKVRLDDIIPHEQKIDFIKIDVEGGDLPVLRGAKGIIIRDQPIIIFESGLGASEFYGTTGAKLYEFLVNECGMVINTMDRFLAGREGLGKEELEREFNDTSHYYFIACRDVAEEERIRIRTAYILDMDMRLFYVERQLNERVCQQPALPDLERLAAERDRAIASIAAMRASRSWRITSLLRRVSMWLQGHSGALEREAGQ